MNLHEALNKSLIRKAIRTTIQAGIKTVVEIYEYFGEDRGWVREKTTTRYWISTGGYCGEPRRQARSDEYLGHEDFEPVMPMN